MKCSAWFLLCVLGWVWPGGVSGVRAELVISELQAANGDTVRDEDGDTGDWMEIYNSGSAAVSLAGYSLTNDPARMDRWVLPAGELAAGARGELGWSSEWRKIAILADE